MRTRLLVPLLVVTALASLPARASADVLITPFAGVTSSAGLSFTASTLDVAFKPGDTAVIKTGDGHYFKIGNATCVTPDPVLYPGCGSPGFGVTFQYTRIP